MSLPEVQQRLFLDTIFYSREISAHQLLEYSKWPPNYYGYKIISILRYFHFELVQILMKTNDQRFFLLVDLFYVLKRIFYRNVCWELPENIDLSGRFYFKFTVCLFEKYKCLTSGPSVWAKHIAKCSQMKWIRIHFFILGFKVISPNWNVI